MTEHYSFANDEAGLVHALHTTLSLRRAGYRTRLVENRVGRDVLQTVHAVEPERPNRRDRGCFTGTT
jgi:hypothetical protein